MAVLLLAWTPSGAVTLGQVDDFEDGTVMGWIEGAISPDPPTNQPNGGPAGAGDNYLLNNSSGIFGAGGRLVMFNQTQWAGNYPAAGVTRIDLQMANFGAATLHMRIAIQGGAGTRYASTTAVALPADGVWYSASFGLTSFDLTNVGGLSSLADVLVSVNTLRILSASAGPAWLGDVILASLGVDNIQAAGAGGPPPVPDGTFGSPMLASRGDPAGSVIDLTWDVSTCQASDYHVLFGSLANVASLGIDGGICSIGTVGSFTWSSVPAGDLWFLVVGDDGASTEGSWGTDSSDAQRAGKTASGVCAIVDRANTGTCP
jgi:hypothetical protein